MGRKTAEVLIEAEGRDKGKLFLLTEKHALDAERWGRRFGQHLLRGVEIPEHVRGMGMIGIASMGFKAIAKIEGDVADGLMNEMLECVEIYPDPKRRDVKRKLIKEDIEEVPTIWHLRERVWELHVGFTFAEAVLMWTTLAASTTETLAGSPST